VYEDVISVDGAIVRPHCYVAPRTKREHTPFGHRPHKTMQKIKK